ncbi:NAD-dependent epimerase/dehydratase family protein [Vulgatibacter sp.]|uniref:NAD-dependent epimerase/dehydratase family protein n=1 Tax=Vulgatibacter sp. TaxID=1971226 RepID=UPI0035635871
MKALVTGGGGFLGSNLVRALLARGDEVRVLARGDYPALRALGAETLRGDVSDGEAVRAACAGMEVVFHTAALAGGWGDPRRYEAVNVGGTENVLAGCSAAGVPVLVHTSTPSVVHVGGDIEGGDESLPYADEFLADYPRTKAEAERRVRAASDERLRTVSIRPHFIWGPGDRHLLPRLVERSRAGRLRRVGGGDPLVDTIYVDNCVHAHLLAADRLRAGAAIGGRAYFVSDGEPVGVWTMANRMLEAAGEKPIAGSVPRFVAHGAGVMLEAWHRLTGNEREPLMTRFGASQLGHAQWFDIGAARRDLGYEPIVSREEGLRRLAARFATPSV